MQLLKTMQTFTKVESKELSIPAKNIVTKMSIYWGYEENYPIPGEDFDFGNKLENEKYLMEFQSGNYLNICIKVTATSLGEEGTDILGQCHISAKNMEADILECVDEHDMNNKACIELRNKIIHQYKTFKEELGA